MSYTAHTETRDGLTLSIVADDDARDPRAEWDNLAVMVCDHGRYNLGDEDGHRKARAAIRASKDYRENWEDPYGHKDGLDFEYGPDLFKAIQRCSDIVWLPLYLYDHSGITMRTTRFSCPWDSGQVGFAFITRNAILDNWGGKVLTAKLREKAEAAIVGEVETYDQFLRGEVYGYVIGDEEDDHIESCWGFYGDEYALEEGKAAFEALLEERAKDAAFLDGLDIPAVS